MNRRNFFRFLPGAAVTSVAGIAGALAGPPKLEDVDGILVSKKGGLVIKDCVFYNDGSKPSLVIKQA